MKYYEALAVSMMAAAAEPPASVPADGAPIPQVAIYRRTKEELDRLLGKNVSYPKRLEAIVDVLKRERLVEKVKRRIIGVEEAIGEYADVVASTGGRIIRDSKHRDAATGRVEPRHRVR